MKNYFIKKQLVDQGESAKDAKELADVAQKLHGAYPQLSTEAKKQIAHDIGFTQAKTTTSFRFATAGAFAVLLVLVLFAQSAQPGSVLYALKRGSEEVRLVLQPGFDDDDIQQRRDDESKRADEDSHEQEDTSGRQTDAEKDAEDAAENNQKVIEDSQKDAEDAVEEAEKQREDAAKDLQDANKVESSSNDD